MLSKDPMIIETSKVALMGRGKRFAASQGVNGPPTDAVGTGARVRIHALNSIGAGQGRHAGGSGGIGGSEDRRIRKAVDSRDGRYRSNN